MSFKFADKSDTIYPVILEELKDRDCLEFFGRISFTVATENRTISDTPNLRFG